MESFGDEAGSEACGVFIAGAGASSISGTGLSNSSSIYPQNKICEILGGLNHQIFFRIETYDHDSNKV